MSHGNGAPSPLHLTGNEPLIGQPKAIGGTLVIVATCPCGDLPLTLTSQIVRGQLQSLPNTCAKCRTSYALAGMQVDPQGQIAFQLVMTATA